MQKTTDFTESQAGDEKRDNIVVRGRTQRMDREKHAIKGITHERMKEKEM